MKRHCWLADQSQIEHVGFLSMTLRSLFSLLFLMALNSNVNNSARWSSQILCRNGHILYFFADEQVWQNYYVHDAAAAPVLYNNYMSNNFLKLKGASPHKTCNSSWGSNWGSTNFGHEKGYPNMVIKKLFHVWWEGDKLPPCEQKSACHFYLDGFWHIVMNTNYY